MLLYAQKVSSIHIAKFAVRTRERLAVLRPIRSVLLVHALRWPEEIRDPGEIAPPVPVTERELQLGQVLIELLTGVDIASLYDEYGAALEQVVTTKLEGLGWYGASRAAARRRPDAGAGGQHPPVAAPRTVAT